MARKKSVDLCSTAGCREPKFVSDSGRVYGKCVECRRAYFRQWREQRAKSVALARTDSPAIRVDAQAVDALPVAISLAYVAEKFAKIVGAGLATVMSVSAELPDGVVFTLATGKKA